MAASFAHNWVWIFAGVAFALTLFEIWLRRSGYLGSLIRILWIMLLGFALAEYTKVIPQEMSEPEPLHVFVDSSDSMMEIPERVSRMKTYVEEIQSWAKSKNQPLQYYTFGDTLLSQPEITWPAMKGLPVTRVFPIEEYLRKNEIERGASVIVTDGLWLDMASSPIPTFNVQVGEPEKERDIWIDGLQNSQTAFLKNRLKIPFSIMQKGFEGKEVSVELVLGQEVVDQKTVRLSTSETPVELTYFPSKMGESIFRIRVQTLEGELSDLNNEVPFRVRVVRDKIRILHIGGKPSYDMKAWRLFLTRQPDVDLVSFYILRSLNDDPEARNNELSLIPFPYDELFSTELEKFDVIILQNFDFNLYFQPFYLSNLATFIRQGGALLMIAGDQSYHRYLGSPLEGLFPFEFDDRAGRFEMAPQNAAVVQSHPLIRGLENAFTKMPWSGYHSITSLPSSTTVVRFANNTPLISFTGIEQGRVLSINSDELWKMQMSPSIEGGGMFGRFARRVLQYLTFDPEMDTQRIQSGSWQVGQIVKLVGSDQKKRNWKISKLWPNGGEVLLNVADSAQAEILVPSPGVYQVEADQMPEPFVEVTQEQPWREEWKYLIAKDSKMKTLSESSQGKFFRYEDREKLFDESISGQQILNAQVEPWVRSSMSWIWLLLGAILLSMSLDFFLRKKRYWDI